MGFIEDFMKVATKLTDAPELYLRAAAYFCTSFLFGVNVYCTDSRVERNNVWFMLSGTSGITRKSTVINFIAVKFCKVVLEEALKRRFGIKDSEAKRLVNLMFFESGTSEGITDHLSLTHDMPEIDRYALASTEYGAVLSAASKKDYLSDYYTFLSKLYSGEGGNVLLSSKGKKPEDRIRQLPEGLYVCALVGLQELYNYFDPRTITQGFARRFIMLHADIESKERRLPPIDPTYKIAKAQFKNLPSRYEDMFDNYNDPATMIFVTFTPEARQIVNKVWEKCERDYEQDPTDSWLLYKQASWEHLYKLSVLEAISRTPDPQYDVTNTRMISVDEKDVKRAGEFLKACLESMRPMFALIEAAPRRTSLRVHHGELSFVKELVRGAGNRGITKSELIKKSGLLARQLDELLITLMTAEEISCFMRNSSGKGRKKLVFFYKGREPNLKDFSPISADVYKTLIK